jgi:hypothetical protein
VIVLGVLVAFPSQPLGIGLIVSGIVWGIWNFRRKSRSTDENHQLRERIDAGLIDAIQHELVAAIEDGKSLGPDAFRPPEYGPYKIWREKSGAYVETVFGSIEKQKFGEPIGEPATTLADNIDDHLKRLANLRDRPKTWDLKVNAEGARKAAKERRFYSVPHQIVVSGTPLERRISDEDREGRDQAPKADSASESPAPARGFPGEKRIERTALDLLAYNEHHTAAQLESMLKPYIGRPIEVQGALNNVNKLPDGSLHVLLTLPNGGNLVSANCAPAWFDSFLDRQKGEPVTLIGRLSRVGVNTIDLTETELVN